MALCRKEFKIRARQEVKMEASLLSGEVKQEKPLPRVAASPHKRRKRDPQLSLEVELLSVCSFYGKLLIWGARE